MERNRLVPDCVTEGDGLVSKCDAETQREGNVSLRQCHGEGWASSSCVTERERIVSRCVTERDGLVTSCVTESDGLVSDCLHDITGDLPVPLCDTAGD